MAALPVAPNLDHRPPLAQLPLHRHPHRVDHPVVRGGRARRRLRLRLRAARLRHDVQGQAATVELKI